MFIIVETLERGSKNLTIVPAGWEANGQLSWPKYRPEKLIKLPNSVPEDDSWFRMKCKLKRNHLNTYAIAEEELDRMLDKDDTEQEHFIEEGISSRKKRARIVHPDRNRNNDNDFNTVAKSCLIESSLEQNTTNVIADKVSVPIEILQTSLNTYNDENSYVILADTASAISDQNQSIAGHDLSAYYETSSSDQLSNKLDKILANQATIIEKQDTILENIKNIATSENQFLIIQQLAKFEAMIDTIGNNITFSSFKSSSDATKIPNIDDGINPIDCVDELIKLEQELTEKTKLEEYTGKLSHICGRRGTGNGINNCYILVDRMFSRKFMTLCSWAGGARDKKEKIPFKIYKRVIQLFFKVIQLSDREFSLKDCEDFFKNVIRNSTRRNESERVRCSTTKRRPKNLSYKPDLQEAALQDQEDDIIIEQILNEENDKAKTADSEEADNEASN